MKATVTENPETLVDGRLVYDNMTTALSSTRSLQNVSIVEPEPGVCKYNFTLDVDSNGTTLSWAMADSKLDAQNAVWQLTRIKDPKKRLEEKTQKWNDILNNDVPYFRCSDPDIVQVYYFQYALHAMMYTFIGKGQEQYPHVQSAVNNFLG